MEKSFLKVCLITVLWGWISLFSATPSDAQIVLLDSFVPPDLGELNGIGFDAATGNLLLHASSNASLHIISPEGVILDTIPDPGAQGNDSDYDFVSQTISIGGVSIPADTLLVFEGDSSTEFIAAVEKTTGTVLVTLPLAGSGMTEGAYHNGRMTFFTINFGNDVIREVNPATGVEITNFGFGPGSWDAFFNDVDILEADGNLYLVSDTQNTIRVMTPDGSFVRDIDVGALGLSGMSGLAFDDNSGEAWVSSTNGTVYRLGGFEAIPEPATITLFLVGLAAMAIRLAGSKRTPL